MKASFRKEALDVKLEELSEERKLELLIDFKIHIVDAILDDKIESYLEKKLNREEKNTQ